MVFGLYARNERGKKWRKEVSTDKEPPSKESVINTTFLTDRFVVCRRDHTIDSQAVERVTSCCQNNYKKLDHNFFRFSVVVGWCSVVSAMEEVIDVHRSTFTY